jgi:D-alanyl-D-alanine carboxypeptidase/D-alanyl-D-alanine-endopeptidase (penicillin-binding protein 4)
MYIHYSSKTLEEIIRACLKYSNNFIANQLFLACGAATSQFPATWDKSRRFMNNYLTSTLMLSNDQIRIVEGSGLSRQNSITPLAFLQILERFKPHANLLSKKDDIVLKSGTLSDVFSFAGYLHEKTLRPFVILLNQPENTKEDILQLFHATFPR